MGLAERRATEQFQSTRLPTLVAELQQCAGFAIPLEIEWKQLAYEGRAGQLEIAWTKIFFDPLIAAFRQIGRDDMGKTALKACVKKIELANTLGAWSPSVAITFREGVLRIDHDFSNLDDVTERTEYMITLIEKAM